MPQCLISGKDFEPFLSFGKMPIANGFLRPESVGEEYFFNLAVGFCPESRMVQLTELVDEARMFHENYAFFSSTSAYMARHFETFAGTVKGRYLAGGKDPFVVEIGSNDGILLRHFAGAGIRHLGIEPSANVAETARQKGIRTVSRFFNEDLARAIVAEHGQADAFLGANVMCHIPYLHSVVEGIRLLLKPGGVLVFEDPYLGDILSKNSFDQIYDEHAFYFSVASVDYLMAAHGLEVVNVEPQSVHGGSMRYTVAHKGALPVSPAVAEQRLKEEAQGLGRPETYEAFAGRVRKIRADLVALLTRLRRDGKRVTAYGATSKSTTVTNYCGIGPGLVESICDTTPIKQGKLSPGAHIPVVPYADFSNRHPDYALLFAWNHAAEITAKEGVFRERGGKFILYVPEVHLL
ncbi:MAG: SAM-dependent methyltransferase [Fibrobacteria bacterium]|nr:SAM-dependent methyltransferase [Fibrobacteria bacterium]